MPGIAQGMSHAQSGVFRAAPARTSTGRALSPGGWKPDRVGAWPGGGGSRAPAGTDLPSLSLGLARLLQLQHHPAAPPGCQLAAQPPPAPLVLAPCDGALLVSGLRKELGLGPGLLLPPPLLQAGGSHVASAAQLLDAHLRISSSTAPGPAAVAPQPCFATLSPSLEPAGLPQGDCEMEDLTSGPPGTFVLVQ